MQGCDVDCYVGRIWIVVVVTPHL